MFVLFWFFMQLRCNTAYLREPFSQKKGFIDEIGWVSGEFTKRDHVLHVVDRGGNTMKWKKNHWRLGSLAKKDFFYEEKNSQIAQSHTRRALNFSGEKSYQSDLLYNPMCFSIQPYYKRYIHIYDYIYIHIHIYIFVCLCR